MISIIITAYKEPDTIAQALDCILDKSYSGLPDDFELITVIPDAETHTAAKNTIQRYTSIKWIDIRDPQRGKPHALNLAFQKAKGEILILTDGDVYFEEGAVKRLLAPFSNEEVGAVTGRPVSIDQRSNFMGYMGHLLADAAHHKRMVTMNPDAVGKSLKLVSREPYFFVLSGYIMAIRNLHLQIPEDCLIDDAYVSYVVHNQKYQLAYQPDAKVNVRYARNLHDWLLQKQRSVGGYVQLWKYNVITEKTKVRNFWKELQYFWFPIRYASNFRELVYSLLIYPLRLFLWLKIFIQQKILKLDLDKLWVRVESTKSANS